MSALRFHHRNDQEAFRKVLADHPQPESDCPACLEMDSQGLCCTLAVGHLGWHIAHGYPNEPLSVWGVSAPTLELIAEDHRSWAQIADDYLDRRIRTGRPFSAYDLELDGCPAPVDHHAWGQYVQTAARHKRIRFHGTRASGRPGSHSTLIRTWIAYNAKHRP